MTLHRAMETMAEHAWRYGLDAEPSRLYCNGWLFNARVFRDNSAVLFRPLSGDPLCVIHDLALLPYTEVL